MAMYRDATQDSELRIAAYLAVMQCPSPYFITQIKETLASEEVKQVRQIVLLSFLQFFACFIRKFYSHYYYI